LPKAKGGKYTEKQTNVLVITEDVRQLHDHLAAETEV